MHLRTTFALAAASAVVLAGLQPATGSPLPARDDPREAAAVRLEEDAGGALRITRASDGRATFVGAGDGSVRNPVVTSSTPLRAAAEAHVDRYAAAFGLDDPGRSLTVTGTARTAAHEDVVRFSQEVSGLPVIGGELVVTLGGDRQLRSALATVSGATSVPEATVSEQRAAAVARDAVARSWGSAVDRSQVTSEGHWVWDASLLDATATASARGVWRFTVGDGAALKRLVLVDDRTGRVLLDLDEIQAVDRVVCDRANTPGYQTPCTSGFARQEGDPATGQADVDAAYRNAGRVSTFYADVAGLDLTQLLGVTVSGTKRLASTVRYCPSSGSCPYANAFWNDVQMFYGAGYAAGDDVVGHEMTHGVISKNADLFYWGQSGAINESLADIMGEIIDHRFQLDAADATWNIGEDIPGGAIRTMSNPPARSDPDRTGSPLWVASSDNGGVHTNSGVGNKTAYLISQGGTFNGQTIAGIDGADTSLDKTAHLYADAIVKLTSGSDYANLADVLEQSCAAFAGATLHGFTPGDCVEVNRAVTATELRVTPTNAPQPPDAPVSCPAGSTYRLLADGDNGGAFTADPAPAPWAYGVDPVFGRNAVTGTQSWYAYDPDPSWGDPAAISMSSTTPVPVPVGQPTYLWFQQWRRFEWYPPTSTRGRLDLDGGVVEVDDVADPAPAQDTAGLPWVNGPADVLDSYPGDVSQWAGRTAFGADSFGWTASRVDLSSYAGRTIRVRYAALGDSSVASLGWWLDDVQLYTCDVPPAPPPPAAQPSSATGPVVKGRLGKAVVTWRSPTANPAAVTGYRVTGGGTTVTVPASAHRAVVKGLRAGRTYTFDVTALGTNGYAAPAARGKARSTQVTLVVEGARGGTGLSGKLKAGGKGLKGKVLKVLTKKKGRWVKVAKAVTRRKGVFAVSLESTSARPYKILFAGAKGLMGSTSPRKRLK